MRLRTKLLIGSGMAAVLILAVGYAELVLDFCTPRSNQFQNTGLGASASLSLHEYNIRRQRMRQIYGDERASVAIETGTGRLTVTLDGKIIEETWIPREFAGMYGMFVVGHHDGEAKHIFPFAIDPGTMPSDHEPNIRRLRSRFDGVLPAQFLAFNDSDWDRNSCALSPVPDFGRLAVWVHIKTGTFCVVHWKGAAPAAMLITVALAENDPWLRPFARRICHPLTTAALEKLAASGRPQPDYAACVLVDRPQRTGPSGTQGAFTSVVYEVREGRLARIP